MSQYKIGQLLAIHSVTETINDQGESSFDIILKFLLTNNNYHFCKTYIKKETKIEGLSNNDFNSSFTEILLPIKQNKEQDEVQTPWSIGALHSPNQDLILDGMQYKADVFSMTSLDQYSQKEYGYIEWKGLQPESTYWFNLGFSDAKISYEKITDILNAETDNLLELYVYDDAKKEYTLNLSTEYDSSTVYYKKEIVYFPTTGYCDFPLIYKTPKSSYSNKNNVGIIAGNFLETPKLDDNQPAFSDSNKSLSLSFQLNNSFQSYRTQIKISSIYDGKTLLRNNLEYLDITTDNFEKTVVIEPRDLKEGKWSPGIYKIQMRILGKNVQSDWSNSSFVKVLDTEPVVYIANNIIYDAKAKTIEESLAPTFNGVCKTSSDEPLKWCKFIIYNKNNQIIEQSEKIQDFSLNANTDKDQQKINISYTVQTPLSPQEEYYLLFKINTLNNFTKEIAYNFTVQSFSVPKREDYELKILTDTENGKNQIFFIKRDLETSILPEGEWELRRYGQKDNYTLPSVLKYYSTKDLINKLEDVIYEDYLIESGEPYKYTLYYKNYIDEYEFQITKFDDSEIINHFEYCYLYSQGKQLKLSLNNTLNSFKKNIQQAKQDMLGSKYPVIVRNGLACYAEFPVTALISAQINDNEFLKVKKDGYYYDDVLVIRKNREMSNISLISNSNLDGQNIYIERLYREKVEEFLNDGNLKLFKSPTEGNFIISLINVTFSPNQQLGRMLASFTSTAYEMMQYSIDNIYKSKIMDFPTRLEKSEYFSDSTYWFHSHIGYKRESDTENPRYSIEENLALSINGLTARDRNIGQLLHTIKTIAIYNRGTKENTIVLKNQEAITVPPLTKFIVPSNECNLFDYVTGENFDIDLVVTTQYLAKRKKIATNYFPLMFSINTREETPLCYNVKIEKVINNLDNVPSPGYYFYGANNVNYYTLYYINGTEQIAFGNINKNLVTTKDNAFYYSNIFSSIPDIHNQILSWKSTNVLLDWEIEDNTYESQLDSYDISNFTELNLYNYSSKPIKERAMINDNIIEMYSNLYAGISDNEKAIFSFIIPSKIGGLGVASILYTHREGGIY